MQTHQAEYFNAYRTMKMVRDAKGVLVVEFHSNDGPCTFSAQHHTEVVDGFHRVAQDRGNKIVILTGAGGDFIYWRRLEFFWRCFRSWRLERNSRRGHSGLRKHSQHTRPCYRGYRRTRAHPFRLCAACQRDCGGRGCDVPGCRTFRRGCGTGRRHLYDVELSRWSRASRSVPAESAAAASSYRI